MTPEGKVKKEIRKVLDAYPVYQYWPVPGGYGKRTVDVLGCINGKFFVIEAKAPGKKPTKLQEDAMQEVREAGGQTFVIDSVDSPQLETLRTFLASNDPR